MPSLNDITPEQAGAVIKAMKETVNTALENDLEADPFMVRVVTDTVMAACRGDHSARQWLQTDGKFLLTAVGRFLEDGGEPYF